MLGHRAEHGAARCCGLEIKMVVTCRLDGFAVQRQGVFTERFPERQRVAQPGLAVNVFNKAWVG